MKKILVVLLMSGILGTAALADDSYGNNTAPAQPAAPAAVAKSGQTEVLNNIIKMDAAGARTALCCCGAEFTVTDNSPTIDHGGTTFYLCGDGCKQMADKATAAENAKTMKAWHKKFRAVKLVTNSYQQDGKEMATCLCGKTLTVTRSTPYVTENGVKMYLCSDACSSALHGMSADARMAKELDVIKGTAGKQSKDG
jgi:hypothetical protein